MISFIFAAASYGGNYYFTKGFEDQATYTRNFSDLNNWAVSEVQYDNDYYNSDAIKSSTLPGVGDVIVLGRDSNYNGPTYEAGVTDILYIDTDVLVGGINQNTGSPYTKTTVVMAKDGGTLTFDSTKNTQILNKSFDSEDFRLAMDFSVNYGNNAGFTNSSKNDLYIGAANGSSVAELKTSDGTANGSIKEWQFNVTGSGNIIVNAKLASIKSTTVFINGGGTGKTIFQGNAASDINTITLATEAIVAFDMRDAMVTSMGTFTFEITLRQNSRLEFCGNNQVPLLTEIRLKNHPTFAVSKSENVNFDNVTIYGAGGMGILGQNSRDIRVRNCKVTPSGNRMISCTADATHFVNCEGEIVLDSNLFENQMDDATNIHGIYEQIVSIDGDTAVTRLVHPQQHGFETFEAGQKVEFVGGRSMKTLAEGKITSVERINNELKRLKFAEPVSDSVKPNDAIAVIRDYPEIKITNNTIRRNRARGMLLNCRGKTLVENNLFQAPGAALLFEGDSCYWFEQGGVRDCTIRGNTFDNCRFGVWGKAIIDVAAGIKEDFETSRYNRNILIENNTFNVFDDTPLLNIYCVDGLVWRNNKVNKTSEYPARDIKKPEPFIIKHSDNIKIDN